MTWKQKTVVRILILIAKIVSGDENLNKAIQELGNHISAGFGENK